MKKLRLLNKLLNEKLLGLGGKLLKYVTILTYIFILSPFLMVVLMSFHPSTIPYFPPPSLSLRWYQSFFADVRLIRAVYNSLIVAICASLLSAIIGVMAALALVRYKLPGFLNIFLISPMFTPEVITGVALLIFLSQLGFSLREHSFLYLIIGHTLITLPYMILLVQSRLYGFDRSLEEAAMNLGATELETFKEVTLPLIAPSIMAGMLFTFVISLDEFTATQFWVSPKTETIPYRIYTMLRTGLRPDVNVLGSILAFLTILLPLITKVISKKE